MIDVLEEESDYAPIPASEVKNSLRVPKFTHVSLVELSNEEVDGEPLDERVIARPKGPMSLDPFAGKTGQKVT